MQSQLARVFMVSVERKEQLNSLNQSPQCSHQSSDFLLSQRPPEAAHLHSPTSPHCPLLQKGHRANLSKVLTQQTQ